MRVAFVALVLLLASPGLAVTFNVSVETDGNDANPGDGICNNGFNQCTLRAAIQQSNALLGADTVLLPEGVYRLTVQRDTDVADNQSGDLDVTSAITLIGVGDDSPCNGSGCTVIDGSKVKDRVFDVHGGGDVVIQDLVILNGKAQKDDANNAQPGQVSGGCLRIDGAGAGLTLENVTVQRCKSPGDGGCVGFTEFSAGNISDTFLEKCQAKDAGGGVDADAATLTLDRVTISKSKAQTGGGVAASGGTLTLKNVTLSKNKGKVGGGLAVESDAAVTVNNTTFFDNKGKDSACIFADDATQTTPVTVSNSLLRSGGKELNCLGPIESEGGNLENGVTCPFTGANDCPDCDPSIVSQLIDNGGEVPTHAIEQNSQAINRGNAMTCETTDARDFPRNGTCDSGAFEFGATPPP